MSSLFRLIILACLTLVASGSLGASAYANGSFKASGVAPGDKSDATPKDAPNEATGTLTITSVTVGGNTVAAADYDVINQGLSTAYVHFHEGKAPAKAAKVVIEGTCSGAGAHPNGTITFS